jgi:hypothetical protein
MYTCACCQKPSTVLVNGGRQLCIPCLEKGDTVETVDIFAVPTGAVNVAPVAEITTKKKR